MKKNIGIICDNIKKLNNINNYPNNLYIIYYSNLSTNNELYNAIEFLISNNCTNIYIASTTLQQSILEIKNKFKDILFYQQTEDIVSYSNALKIILYNATKKKIKDKITLNFTDYNTLNTIRKDTNPKTTIKNIKKILKENNYKVKEKHIRKNLNGLYSLRLELNNSKGANGKGITLNYAKASAYAELIERLQSNMLTKKRINTNTTNRDPKKYIHLLNNANKNYKKDFFNLDDIYFNEEKLLNLKSKKYEYMPINAINCFCHTNGLASGNSFEEAVSQAIFEILERHCYQELLNNNYKIKNIDISKYPLNNKNQKLLKKLTKLGYKYYIKDCSLGRYPVLGFMLLNSQETKYTFTIASDYSFDIALSRCITEMMQGLTLKDLNKQMLNKYSLNKLDHKYKKNYKSYNWLKCFNNNNGYLSENFFEKEYIDIKDIKFKNYFFNNSEVLEQLKKDIEYDIYIKDYNTLGFNTYRVYIPYITSVDSYDNDDLLVNKNYTKLSEIYSNILNVSSQDINFFIDIFLKLNKNIKYDELIKPSDLFHLDEITDYYKLDFTSLLFVLALITKRENDICELLNYKLDNFNLSDIKIITYKIIINLLTKKRVYKIENTEIETSLQKIIDNPTKYLHSLKPLLIKQKSILINKKSLT